MVHLGKIELIFSYLIKDVDNNLWKFNNYLENYVEIQVSFNFYYCQLIGKEYYWL